MAKDDNVLLKLRRAYSKDETVAWLSSRIKSKDLEIGKMKSEIADLRYKRSKRKEELTQLKQSNKAIKDKLKELKNSGDAPHVQKQLTMSDHNKFITQDIAKENKLVRLTIVENDIKNINNSMIDIDSQINTLLQKKGFLQKKIANKYDYHKILSEEIEQEHL